MILIFTLTVLILIGDLVWAMTDPRPHVERVRRPMTLTYPRVTLALLPQVPLGLWVPWPIWPTASAVLGSALVVLGLGLAIWARMIMGSAWGVPGQHDIGSQSQLITGGPFAFSRNPIYVGVLLMMIGFAVAVRSYGAVLAVPLFLSLRRSIRQEEAALLTLFPEDYHRYRKQVGRYLT